MAKKPHLLIQHLTKWSKDEIKDFIDYLKAIHPSKKVLIGYIKSMHNNYQTFINVLFLKWNDTQCTQLRYIFHVCTLTMDIFVNAATPFDKIFYFDNWFQIW